VFFRVHAHIFLLESDAARAVVGHLRHPEPDSVVFLEGVGACDLERFLAVVYCKYALHFSWHSSYLPPRRFGEKPKLSNKGEWTSVLALSTLWDFPLIRAHAIAELSTLTSAVDKIVLGARYTIPEWLPPAYLALCEQPAWPTDEDCRRLGFDVLIRLGRAREALRCGAAPALVSPAARSAIVARYLPNSDRSSRAPTPEFASPSGEHDGPPELWSSRLDVASCRVHTWTRHATSLSLTALHALGHLDYYECLCWLATIAFVCMAPSFVLFVVIFLASLILL
jgi:hypothetical protein